MLLILPEAACAAAPAQEARTGLCQGRQSSAIGSSGQVVTQARAARGSLKWRCARLPLSPACASMPFGTDKDGLEGAGPMARLRVLAAAASIASMAFTAGWALPASAGTSTGASTYSEPTWWQKF